MILKIDLSLKITISIQCLVKLVGPNSQNYLWNTVNV
jgi:hypothetical protein